MTKAECIKKQESGGNGYSLNVCDSFLDNVYRALITQHNTVTATNSFNYHNDPMNKILIEFLFDEETNEKVVCLALLNTYSCKITKQRVGSEERSSAVHALKFLTTTPDSQVSVLGLPILEETRFKVTHFAHSHICPSGQAGCYKTVCLKR